LQQSDFFFLVFGAFDRERLGLAPPTLLSRSRSSALPQALTNWLRAHQFFPFASDLAVKVTANQFRLPG
jgi:hypothetical protein